MGFMVEMVVGIKLIRSRLYGGDRGEICNFLFLFPFFFFLFPFSFSFLFFFFFGYKIEFLL